MTWESLLSMEYTVSIYLQADPGLGVSLSDRGGGGERPLHGLIVKVKGHTKAQGLSHAPGTEQLNDCNWTERLGLPVRGSGASR